MIRKKITQISLNLTLLLALLAPGALLLSPQPAYASTGSEGSADAACEAIGLAGAECGGAEEKKVSDTVATIVNILSWIVGLAAVIMIIISGLKYVTSNGDSNSISSAKSTLVYAIIGLIIVALAQVIVAFVLDSV